MAVTQATSCCSVVTVMRTGSADIDRLKDRGTHRRTERERESGREMHGRSKAGFMQGVKKTDLQREEWGGEEVDRSQPIGGLSSDSLTEKELS